MELGNEKNDHTTYLVIRSTADSKEWPKNNPPRLLTLLFYWLQVVQIPVTTILSLASSPGICA